LGTHLHTSLVASARWGPQDVLIFSILASWRGISLCSPRVSSHHEGWKQGWVFREGSRKNNLSIYDPLQKACSIPLTMCSWLRSSQFPARLQERMNRFCLLIWVAKSRGTWGPEILLCHIWKNNLSEDCFMLFIYTCTIHFSKLYMWNLCLHFIFFVFYYVFQILIRG
jgi:hypothetical protein